MFNSVPPTPGLNDIKLLRRFVKNIILYRLNVPKYYHLVLVVGGLVAACCKSGKVLRHQSIERRQWIGPSLGTLSVSISLTSNNMYVML